VWPHRNQTREIGAEENGGRNGYFIMKYGHVTRENCSSGNFVDVYSVLVSSGLPVSRGFPHSIRMNMRIII
jgi:hypothetical protein